MKRSRITEEQITGILREQESGQKTADVCKRQGISEAAFCYLCMSLLLQGFFGSGLTAFR